MTLRILIFALTLSAVHAQEPPKCRHTGADGSFTLVPCEWSESGNSSADDHAFKPPRVEAPISDPSLGYQTARANELEAENAALKLQVKNLQMQIVQYQATIGNLTADWPNPQQLQAAQQSAQKALDAARDALKKACGDRWDEVKSTCGK